MKKEIKNILIIGSGPIIIGQASEFDYSGTQACLALREERYNISLINNNPATIMTDSDIANNVHITDMNCEEIEKIIVKDKIDSILPNCGGQTALNLAMELEKKNILSKYNINLLGIGIDTIKYSEDRLLFKQKMKEIGEPICDSLIVHCKQINEEEIKKCHEESLEFIKKHSFPFIIRPSFTLGGTGGGIVNNENELFDILENALKISPIHEVLIEESIYGWKEIEYEIVRDSNDTCIAVCNMENFDPVGIHTGDSIVVAPAQTLNDKIVQMLRTASIKIVRALKIEGACNVQFGLHPITNEYRIIEVNPRVSRSSALASKATAYPIAKIAAKIAVGKLLNEIINDISQISACLEPSLDYIVCKVPEFPFSKFKNVSHNLGTQMKSTGEYMGIGLTFEEAFLKCFDRNNLLNNIDKFNNLTDEELLNAIKTPTDERIYQILNLLNRNIDCGKIEENTYINVWFLNRLKNIFDHKGIKKNKFISFRAIDGTGNEFSSKTNYIFSTGYYNKNEIVPLNHNNDKKTIIIVGSSAIKIGQGIEFDYSSVHAVKSLQKLGYKVVIVNNNPETVSTDYNLADRLYFEPIDANVITEIYKFEKAFGVIIQFGGQTSLNIAKQLKKNKVNILGTDLKSIDLSEDRKKFYRFTKGLHINQPKSICCKVCDVIKNLSKINFPLIIRPSYVIGGSRMKICKNILDLNDYIGRLGENETIFMDEFIEGKEAEIDMVSDKYGNVFIPLIAEHIEGTGIHSGDSKVLYPSRTITEKEKNIMIKYATLLAKELNVIGLMNIQFVIKDGKIYVIEVNLRSSRTIPTINKVCNLDIVDIAVGAIMGNKINIPTFNVKKARKEPVFSNDKITKENVSLGVEMKSTGEILHFEN